MQVEDDQKDGVEEIPYQRLGPVLIHPIPGHEHRPTDANCEKTRPHDLPVCLPGLAGVDVVGLGLGERNHGEKIELLLFHSMYQ